MLQVSSLQNVYLGFFRGMDPYMCDPWMEMLSKHLCIDIPALLVPLFLFPVGMNQKKSLDPSRMIPIAVEVLYFF